MVGDVSTGRPPAAAAPPATGGAAAGRCRCVGGRCSLAAVAGLALLVAFPPYGLWWLAPVGVALLAAGRAPAGGCAAGAGLGVLAGLVFFVPLLAWTNLHAGTVPWLLLSGAAGRATSALLGAGRAPGSARWSTRWRWAWPLADRRCCGSAQEALRDRAPFGGFPWGRLAFSQADSPLLRLAALGGAPLVTFAVGARRRPAGRAVSLVAARAGPARAGARRPGWPAAGATRAAPVLPAVVAVVAGRRALLVPVHRPGRRRPSRVAIVQGNVPRLGLDFNAQRRAVLDNHVDATLELAARVAAGRAAQPDLVVWPENASDIDPLRNPDAAARDRAAPPTRSARRSWSARCCAAPAPGRSRNAGIVWAAGQPAPDREQLYVKRHPVPFAEYMPLRVDRPDGQRQGRPGAHRLRRRRHARACCGSARRRVGDVICFEVAYDERRPRHGHRRRAAARRADQQRDLRRGRGRASSWRWCGCGRSSTAGTR